MNIHVKNGALVVKQQFSVLIHSDKRNLKTQFITCWCRPFIHHRMLVAKTEK